MKMDIDASRQASEKTDTAVRKLRIIMGGAAKHIDEKFQSVTITEFADYLVKTVFVVDKAINNCVGEAKTLAASNKFEELESVSQKLISFNYKKQTGLEHKARNLIFQMINLAAHASHLSLLKYMKLISSCLHVLYEADPKTDWGEKFTVFAVKTLAAKE